MEGTRSTEDEMCKEQVCGGHDMQRIKCARDEMFREQDAKMKKCVREKM